MSLIVILSFVLARLGRYFLVIIMAFLAVSLLVFVLMDNASGDSSAYILAEDAGEGAVASYRGKSGLDTPLFERYCSFIISFMRGEWGRTVSGHDVRALIAHSVPVTLSLSSFSLLIAVGISIPLSVIGARNRIIGCIVSGVSISLMALPSFLIAMFLVIVFSIACGFFPSAGYIPVSRGIIPYIRSLFLPSLTLALLHASLYVRVFRKAVRDGIRSQYSLFALSTGMRRKELALKSAMKPSLPVLLSLISQSLVSAIGGSAVVETVFALPGIGALMVDAALSRDGQLAGIIMILLAISTAVIFFLLEGVLPLADPRIRRGS